MKKTLLGLAFLAAAVSGCKQTDSATTTETTTTTPAVTHQLAGNWYGGTMPCASCEGIEKLLIFEADGTVWDETRYVSDDVYPERTKGSWVLKGDTLTVTTDSTTKQVYLVKPDNVLAALDADNKEVTGELAANYRLTKLSDLTADAVKGEYLKGEENDGYYDKLVITPVEGNKYMVEISSKTAKKGCAFKGEGTLQNNRISIDISKVEPKITSTLFITFQGKNAQLVTSDIEQLNDLMYFCGGGGSLAGDYVKK